MIFETRTVSLGDRSYDIFFGFNISQAVRKWINKFHSGKSIYVVTDQNVASIYGDDIRHWLAEEPEKILTLPPGEEQKTFSAVGRIYAFLSEGKADKDSIIVAFGGGVIGDLTGFAAATFLRGIPFIQIPTTLLAMLDSSVGGKTGFNLPEGKNLVGVFHQPCAVFIDDSFLVTLDDRNLRSGLAEAVKSAIAGDVELWELLAERGSRWKAFSSDDWREIIRRSVSFKISIVEQDERESRLRKILNLGHTIGHALEQSGGYGRLLHGEAVAAGLAWEAVLGRRLEVTPESVVDGILSLLLEMGYELDDSDIPLALIEAAVLMDKKRVVSNIDLPLIVRPGECDIRCVPLEKIRMELAEVRAEIRNYMAEKEKGRGLSYRLKPQESVRSMEGYVEANPRDDKAVVLLANAYLRSGNVTAAFRAIQEALGRNISDPSVLQMAVELEKRLAQEIPAEEDAQTVLPFENLLVMEEDVYQIRAADSVDLLPAEQDKEWQLLEPPVFAPKEKAESLRREEPIPEAAATAPEISASILFSDSTPSIDTSIVPPMETPKEPKEQSGLSLKEDFSSAGTVTLADLYWAQGERSAARKIVRRILEEDPDSMRARKWLDLHGEEDPVESSLETFLGLTAKEFGYDLSRDH